VAAQRSERSDSRPRPVAPGVGWGRPLAVAAAILFFISSAFPIGASLVRDTASFPKWWGVLDVAIAFVLAILAILIAAVVRGGVRKQDEDASYRVYRVLPHGILALLVVFFLAGDRVTWVNCLPGFAWRGWLLVYSLPEWFALLRTGAGPSGGGASVS
jgi:hypothetical protein